MKVFTVAVLLFMLPSIIKGSIWSVGPTQTHTYCSQIVSLVQDGDTVEIDYATYVNDSQVQWNQNDLFIVGVGGRPRLQAGSIIANDPTNGKGIFVVSGNNVTIQNIEFTNASVMDNNGAGIRHQGGNLKVRYCKFLANEMGILSGNQQNTTVLVEHCEFKNSGSSANPGFQHNIYINHIDTFVFRYNYSEDAIAEGHELKSRADNNFILYNRISNHFSDDSRTIDLPNGGIAVIVGNIIEQGQSSVNSNILGFGLEGLTNPFPHILFCTNNTFVNKKSTGSFIQVAFGTDTLFLKNNIMVGAKTGGLIVGAFAAIDSSNNFVNDNVGSAGFVNANMFQYQLNSGSPAVNNGVNINRDVFGYSLDPVYTYKDSSDKAIRPINGVIDIGAYENLLTNTDNPSNTSFQIFLSPNPASETLTIKSSDELIRHVKIYALTGEMIHQNKVSAHYYSVNVNSMIQGEYILQIETDKGEVVRKFQVSK
ncbi:MAG: T9SS type A sorting domain-containing protein [Bacteroidia bacterium]|nr:T9SS type A sorting domain-containing protein [Bacteroidia bacterium]